MHISRLTVRNYKSFFDSSELTFRPGFNMITGQNSSGKTALLEAMSLDFPCVPHRSLRTVPVEGAMPNPISEIDVSVTVSTTELMEFLFARGGDVIEVFLPRVAFDNELARAEQIGDDSQLVQWFLTARSHTFTLRQAKLGDGRTIWSIPSVPSYGNFVVSIIAGQHVNFVQVRLMKDRRSTILRDLYTNREAEVGFQIAPMFAKYVYLFKAERFNLARRRFGGSSMLQPDASNLPEVLNRAIIYLANQTSCRKLVGHECILQGRPTQD